MIQKLFGKIIYDMDIASTEMTNAIPTNATSTMSIKCHNKLF